jgi:glycosyltransferase A (GT-A) superfamily protein (DUF2064 family)
MKMKFGNVHSSRWGVLGAVLAAFSSSFHVLAGKGTGAQIPRWMMPRRMYNPNGAQERARRMRQIAACTLRPCNGLVMRGYDGEELRADSHGYATVAGARVNMR